MHGTAIKKIQALLLILPNPLCRNLIKEKEINDQSKHKLYAVSLAFIICFATNKGLMMDWFNSKHVAKAYEREHELCFDWRFILFSFITILHSLDSEYFVISFIPFMTNLFTRNFFLFALSSSVVMTSTRLRGRKITNNFQLNGKGLYLFPPLLKVRVIQKSSLCGAERGYR